MIAFGFPCGHVMVGGLHAPWILALIIARLEA